jgi:hypothetical protein
MAKRPSVSTSSETSKVKARHCQRATPAPPDNILIAPPTFLRTDIIDQWRHMGRRRRIALSSLMSCPIGTRLIARS